MYKIVAIFALVAVVSAQHYNRDPHTAAILNEQRYLNGDGKFGAAYSQEDGVEFKEESDADGTRRGSYSYVDPSGQRRTVSYTAGKNGFQATGDHLPQAPAAPAHSAPTPGYQPQPQYNSPVQPQYQPQYNNYANSVEDDGQYRPDKYDQINYNQPQPQYQPQQYQQQPQYQPQQHQFQQQPLQQHYQQPQPQYQQPQQQQQYRPQQQYTTAAPHRFYPPGKLSLNRSPDGFSYSFQKS